MPQTGVWAYLAISWDGGVAIGILLLLIVLHYDSDTFGFHGFCRSPPDQTAEGLKSGFQSNGKVLRYGHRKSNGIETHFVRRPRVSTTQI